MLYKYFPDVQFFAAVPTFFEGIALPFFYPYPSSSVLYSHLLSGQDLDVISIPCQVYFIQATTTRFLEPVKLQ